MDHMFPKCILTGSFDFGDEQIISIADDFQKWRKTASSSSPVVAQWGDVKPVPGHTLVHIIALGDYEKTGGNSNGDMFRESLNKAHHNDFIKYGGLFRNHKIGDSRREGYVHKTAHNDEMGRVELMIAADNKKCADWLGKLENGDQVAFSMGFGCSKDRCTYCGETFTEGPSSYCEHTRKKAAYPYGLGRIMPDGHKILLENLEGRFNDISKVGIGADLIAFDLRKVASAANARGEVLSGAELGEMFWIKDTYLRGARVDLAVELSALEHNARQKTAGSWISGRQVPQEIIDAFNAHDNPKEAFGWLHQAGIILPMPEFIKVACGGNWNQIAETAENAWASHLASGSMFGGLDNEARQRVASNLSWEGHSSPQPQANTTLKSALMRDFSPLHPNFATRLIEDMGNKLDHRKVASTIDPAGEALLEQYLAYRLSAIMANASAGSGFLVDSVFCH